VQLHENVSKQVANSRSVEMLKAVAIPRAETRMDDYPHQFSGGMRQRVMIAMALVNNPDLLIADEPTTALDVTTQAQILKLMNQLQRDFGSAIILVTHDLGVVAETADDVLVMYAARVAEKGGYEDIFYRPEHPYTWGLLNSLPRLAAEGTDLKPIPGTPPSLLQPPSGCRFHLRCTYAISPCIPDVPELLPVGGESAGDHAVACHLEPEFRRRESHDLLHEVMAEQQI
jgi:peptide/nickel transport system ATP-binding protein